MRWLLSLVLLATCGGAQAQPHLSCLAPPERVSVADATSAESVTLADGRTVRLADVHVMRPADARETLAALAGRSVALRAVVDAPDRYGRVVGDLLVGEPDATRQPVAVRAPRPPHVAGATHRSQIVGMLADGLALVDPLVMSHECLAGLFAAEADAEAAGRGIWRDRAHARDADALERGAVGTVVLVTGVVRSVGTTRRTLYLNFGEDWRSDFTALVRRTKAAWQDDLASLEGERVRIRGVLDWWNGGLIEVEHPAQIERLGPAAGAGIGRGEVGRVPAR